MNWPWQKKEAPQLEVAGELRTISRRRAMVLGREIALMAMKEDGEPLEPAVREMMFLAFSEAALRLWKKRAPIDKEGMARELRIIEARAHDQVDKMIRSHR